MNIMKKGRKKNKKQKLSALIVLLMLTVVMLSVATYAWFTANNVVTISTLDVNVEAQSGLQISSDAITWKTVLSNADIAAADLTYPAARNQVPAILEPVSTAGLLRGDGYLDIYNGVISAASDSSGDYVVTATPASETDGTSGYYIAFDMFLKTERDSQLYLTTDANVVPKTASPDRGLQNSARVAFVTMGNTAADSTPAQIQALNGGNVGLTANKVYIWEPNYDVHTSFGIIAASAYGITGLTTTGATQVPYKGIKAQIVSEIKIYDTDLPANSAFFETVVVAAKSKAIETAYQPIFEVKTGVTKVRVYMYIEGQDVDCENNASGTDISFNLQLSTLSAPPTP